MAVSRLQTWFTMLAPSGQTIATNAVLTAAGSGAAQVLIAASSIVVARLLGAENFGIYSLVFTVTMIFAGLASSSLGMAGMRYLGMLREARKQEAAQVLRLSNAAALATACIAAVGIWAFAAQIAASFHKPEVDSVLKAASVVVLFAILAAEATGGLLGLESFKTVARLQVLRGVLVACLVPAGAWLHGVFGAVSGLLFSSIIVYALTAFSLRQSAHSRGIRTTGGSRSLNLGFLWGFSLPAALSSATVLPVTLIVQSFLLSTPEGLTQVAVLQVTLTIRALIVFLPGQIGQASMPVMARLFASSGRNSEGPRALLATFALGLVSAAPCAILAALSAPWILRLYGPKFTGNELALQVAASTGLLVAAETAIGNLIAAKGKMWAGFSINLLWALLVLALSAWFVSRGFGVLGINAAFLIAYIVHGISSLVVARQLLHAGPRHLRSSFAEDVLLP